MSRYRDRLRQSLLFDAHPLNTCILEDVPPKFGRGPPFGEGQNSPSFLKTKVPSWHVWAWYLLMLQMQLVFASDPSQAIDFVLSKYDHAGSPSNHGHSQFGQGQDHGSAERFDVLTGSDAVEKNGASEKRPLTQENTLSQNGLQFKVKSGRTASNDAGAVDVFSGAVLNGKESNVDSTNSVLVYEERNEKGETQDESGPVEQKPSGFVETDVNFARKTTTPQEKEDKLHTKVMFGKSANKTTSRKAKGAAGSKTRCRRGVGGLPTPPQPMSMPGLILAHGYPAEVHHVRTEDGYILEVHRIPGPRLLDTSPKKRRRNSRRVARGRRDTAQDSELNDLLVALERERIDKGLQNDNLEALLPDNDALDEIFGLDSSVFDAYMRENRAGDGDSAASFHESEENIMKEASGSLSRSKRSEAQRTMMQRRQMIQTVHPRALLNMAQRSRSFDGVLQLRPQVAFRNVQRSNRRSYQRPRRRSHTPLNNRRMIRDRPNFARDNSFNSPRNKNRNKNQVRTVTSFDLCQVSGKCCRNFTAKCSDINLNSDTARTARQIVPLRNSKLNENDSAFVDNDLFNGELNEIDSENLKKNASSSQNFNKSKKHGGRSKKVVFIQHCLQCSSADFVLNDHNQALAFILADEGYDVWLGNFRGNQYSRGHVSLSPRSIKYWQFNVDDLAKYDLPAMVNHVLSKTQSDDLLYIGHSLGTMTFFMASSTNADFLSKIRLMVALAPSGYIDHMKGGLKLMVKGAQTFYGLMESIGIGEIGSVMPWRGGLMSRICKPESVFAGLCAAFLPAMNGNNNGLHDMEYLPSMLSNLPAGTSFRLMAQIGQIIGANGIRKFDYGVEENMRHYGTRAPPHYKLEKVTCPVAIMWSQNDIIVTPVDVARTVKRLPNVVMNYRVPHATFNHVDFLFADIARELVYKPIVKLFSSYT